MSEYGITLKVNGQKVFVSVAVDLHLVDLLNQNLDITSCRADCRKGECGTCTVLMNGKSVTSCLVLALQADGADIVTVEGLREGEGQDKILQQFYQRQLVQCGNCIPGMLVSARHLLYYNTSPTKEEIVEAIAGNHCRCNDSVKFAEAIETAS